MARAASLLAAAVLLASCAAVREPAPAVPPAATEPPAALPSAPRPPAPAPAAQAPQRGKISLYGTAHAGKTTASGAVFDPDALTMAHRTLPFGTRVRVTNLENRQSVEVVVNDRGPYVAGRIADLSVAAARRIGMVDDGVVDGSLEVVSTPR